MSQRIRHAQRGILALFLGATLTVLGTTAESRGNEDHQGSTVKGSIIVGTTAQEADFPSMATVTQEDAQAAALLAVQGAVLEIALDDEDGYLVYKVEVVGPDKSITEVMIDAGNGAVLAMEQDQMDEDDNEDDTKEGDRSEQHEHQRDHHRMR